MPNINPILKAAQSTNQQIDTSSAAITEARTSQAELANNEAQLQFDIGLNNSIIKSVQNNAALATQNARLKAGVIFGADLNQQGEALTEATSLWNDAYRRQLSAAQKIEEKDSVSFLSDPLQYVINQFTVNDDIKEHNAALNVKNIAKTHIDEINAMSSATAKNQENFNQSITQASIEAEAANTARVAQVAAEKAKIQALGYNIEGLKDAVNASKEKLGVLFNVQSAQNAQAQLQISMDNYAMHKKEFQWKEQAVADQEAADEFTIGRMQEGFRVLYGDKAPDLSMNPKLAKNYLSLLKSNTPAGKEAMEAYMAGQTGVLGGNPAQVIDLLKNGVNVQFTPAQNPIKQVFDTTVSEVTANIAAGKVAKPGNAAEASALINTSVKAKVDTMLKNIEPGSSSNLFNIGSVPVLITLPGVADTAFTQKVLAPAVTAGAKLDDPKQVFSTAIAAIGKKEITVEQAVEGITALYQKGVETNLAQRNLPKFGIVPNESMRSYNTTIQTNANAIFGGTEIVNLADENAVKRAVMKSLSMQQFGPAALRFPF